MDKRRPDKPEMGNRLENVYKLAISLSENIKEVNLLLLKLRHQKRHIEHMDALAMKMDGLEKKQEECIRVIKEDLQLLDQVL